MSQLGHTLRVDWTHGARRGGDEARSITESSCSGPGVASRAGVSGLERCRSHQPGALPAPGAGASGEDADRARLCPDAGGRRPSCYRARARIRPRAHSHLSRLDRTSPRPQRRVSEAGWGRPACRRPFSKVFARTRTASAANGSSVSRTRWRSSRRGSLTVGEPYQPGGQCSCTTPTSGGTPASCCSSAAGLARRCQLRRCGGGDRAQRPSKRAGRFWRNAAMPSRASADANTSAKLCFSASIPASRSPAADTRLICWIDRGA